jgi:DNA-binding NarL/FixJ family response regulator
MLKDKEIRLVNVRDASRLQAYLGELQANVTVHECLNVNTVFSANIAEQVDFVIIEVIDDNCLEIARFYAKNRLLTKVILLVKPASLEWVFSHATQFHSILADDSLFDEYIKCFLKLNEGYFYFSESLKIQFSHKQTSASDIDFFFDLLSPREREVLSLLCEGFTNAQIGSSLFISAETVKNHKINIMEKLHLKTNNDLLLWVGEIRKEWRDHFGIK